MTSILARISALTVLSLATACGGESSSDPGPGGSGGNAGTTPDDAGSGAGGGGAGGIGTGGSAAGSSGAGGTAAGGGAGGAAAGVVGECTTDSDCELVTSCCDCVAGKLGSVPTPACPEIPCQQDMCSSMGVKSARCIAGQCTIAANCDMKQSICDSLPPPCPPGKTITVGGHGCWGPCVDYTACAEVESCFVCPAGTACVVNDAWTSSHHCVNPPAGCSGCECLGALACIGGFTECGEFDDGSAVHCSCPTC